MSLLTSLLAAGGDTSPRVRSATLFTAPASTRGTAVFSLGDLWAHPIELATCTLDRIGVEVTSAATAGGVVRLGIWEDDGGVPGALVLDAGTVATTSTGDQLVTISRALAAGFYWLGAVQQVAQCTLRTLSGPTSRISIADNTFADEFSLNSYLRSGAVTGALPDPWGGITQGGASAPVVLLRTT